MRPNDISYRVIGAAMAVHTALGPGLLESAYEKALCREFENRKLQSRRQVRIPVEYEDLRIADAFTIDFIVEELVIVEIKSVERVPAVHRTQLLSYVKLTKLPLGLILNFKVAHMRDGMTSLDSAQPAHSPLRPLFPSVPLTRRLAVREINTEAPHVPEFRVPRLEPPLGGERTDLGERARQRFVDEP
jgi:GxxExxY protein